MTQPPAKGNSSTILVEVIPFEAPLVGAWVRCGDVRHLDDLAFGVVHRAFLDNLMLLIRGQQIDDEELLAFGGRFGALTAAAPVHLGQKPRTLPELAVISNVIENGMSTACRSRNRKRCWIRCGPMRPGASSRGTTNGASAIS